MLVHLAYRRLQIHVWRRLLFAWHLLSVARVAFAHCCLHAVGCVVLIVAPCVVGLVLVDCRWCCVVCCALLVAGVVGSSGQLHVHIVGWMLVVVGVVDYCCY